jgi:hypothetical protein
VKYFSKFALTLICCTALLQARSKGTIDDALSFALEAAAPYVKEGFTVTWR